MTIDHSAQAATRTCKLQRRTVFLWAVLAAVLLGLAALAANGRLYQLLFLPVVFAGVYAAACLLFEIMEELRH